MRNIDILFEKIVIVAADMLIAQNKPLTFRNIEEYTCWYAWQGVISEYVEHEENCISSFMSELTGILAKLAEWEVEAILESYGMEMLEG